MGAQPQTSRFEDRNIHASRQCSRRSVRIPSGYCARPVNWNRGGGAEDDRMTPERRMLLALSMDAQSVPALAVKAGLAHDDAAAALRCLQREHLAIAEDGGYELTGR